MFTLIRFFLELSLLRRAPQDLPASNTLLGVLLVASVAVGWLSTLGIFGGAWPALQANLLDAALLLLLLKGTLQLAGHPARFVQTASALFGVSTLFGCALLAVESVAKSFGLDLVVALAQLTTLAWIHLALGHVLRHAIDKELWLGIMIAMGYTFIGINIVYQLVPPIGLQPS